MRLARRSRSHAAVLLRARDTGVDLTLSVAFGLATFLYTNWGPLSHMASLPCSLSSLPIRPRKMLTDRFVSFA